MMTWGLMRRSFRHWWQRRTRGWDDSETWNLDVTASRFILPRLRRFKRITRGYPAELTEEGWNAILDDMIYALEVCVRSNEEVLGADEADWDRVERGLEAMGKWWRALWW